MRTRLGKLNGGEVLRCAQDFACGLGPPQDGSSSNPLAPTIIPPLDSLRYRTNPALVAKFRLY
jgi:hypothetical protein